MREKPPIPSLFPSPQSRWCYLCQGSSSMPTARLENPFPPRLLPRMDILRFPAEIREISEPWTGLNGYEWPRASATSLFPLFPLFPWLSSTSRVSRAGSLAPASLPTGVRREWLLLCQDSFPICLKKRILSAPGSEECH